MATRTKRHGSDTRVKRGELSKGVRVEQIRLRGVDVEPLVEKLR